MKLDLKVLNEFMWLRVTSEVSERDALVLGAGYRKLVSLGVPWVIVDAAEAEANPQVVQDLLANIQKVRERVNPARAPSILILPGQDFEKALTAVSEPARSVVINFIRLSRLSESLAAKIEKGTKVKQGKLTLAEWQAFLNPSAKKDLPAIHSLTVFKKDLVEQAQTLSQASQERESEATRKSTQVSGLGVIDPSAKPKLRLDFSEFRKRVRGAVGVT